MFLNKSPFLPKIKLHKSQLTSGASRSSFFYKNLLPLQYTFKKLCFRKKWNSGRGASGQIIVWTRKQQSVKNRIPTINYTFRVNSLCFVGGFFLIPKKNKLLSIVFTSTGSVTYVPSASKHELFKITRLNSVFLKKNKAAEQLKFTNPSLVLTATFFIIKQLPKNQMVCLLELLPGFGIQYARSTGTSAKILKMDSRVSTSLIKLPSGVKKVFSTYSLGSVGSVALPQNKKWGNNSAGFYSKHGKKPKVRGVAMNPVDHPHGGRTKAIRYQRTPWGKTTKFK